MGKKRLYLALFYDNFSSTCFSAAFLKMKLHEHMIHSIKEKRYLCCTLKDYKKNDEI